MAGDIEWPKVDGIAYGGDYSPEQWPREIWHEDVALMRTAGVNLVSIGIFSWALLETSEGVFDFAWLDDVIDLLHENGIRVDLGTPTAAPPAWFYAAHPDARVVTRDGVTLTHGSRGMASHSAPAYREAIVRITDALAERYANHPAVVMWHVHNEYGTPVGEDYSAHAVAATATASEYFLFALYCSAPPAFLIFLQSVSWPPSFQCCAWQAAPQ